MARLIRLSTFIVALAALVSVSSAQTRVACIGDSITYGARIADRGSLSYPARLQHRLGEDYEVRNFGLSGRTIRRGSDLPFIEEQAFQDAIQWQPDVAIVLLGTNDTALSAERPNWIEGYDFTEDVAALTDPLRRSNPSIRVLIATSPKIAHDTPGLSEDIVEDMQARIPRLAEVRSQLRRIVRANGDFEFVELSRHLSTEEYSDGFHPNARGADRLAVRMVTAIQSSFARRRPLESRLEKSGRRLTRSAHGELRAVSFQIEGHAQAAVTTLLPERPLTGNPWVYFPGTLEAGAGGYTDLADRGFHVVAAHCETSWTTLPVEVAAVLAKAGLGDGIDGRTLQGLEDSSAVVRAVLRINGSRVDEAYPTTRARSGVSLAQGDWGSDRSWNAAASTLTQTAQRIGRMDVLFLGGTTIYGLTGHRRRVAQPNHERPFDGLAGPFRAASFGVAEERTEHLLYRMNTGALDPLSPRVIVLQIGAHNILSEGHSVAETMDGIARLTSALRARFEHARVVLCTPLPASRAMNDGDQAALATLRSEILDRTFEPWTHVADTGAAFTRQDGTLDETLSPDGLALTPLGEQALVGAIRETLDPLLGF